MENRETNPGYNFLLNRKPIIVDNKKSMEYLKEKRVLITGAGGSIGGEICRQLLHGGTQRLYLFDHSESGMVAIERDLKDLQDKGIGSNSHVVPVLGELQDKSYIRHILKKLKVDIIFHCAAYKHVSMMQKNPIEAIKNNVFGTLNLVDAAYSVGVAEFVLISTDKAVDPVSVYGVSKKISEQIVLKHSSKNNKFMVVRFGNVLGSSGSVIPIFEKQIASGGPLTITDKKAQRYFITIPEAVSLVIKTGGTGSGNSLYALTMGKKIKIKELADTLVLSKGLKPGVDIKYKYIGLQDGERLDEQIIADSEKAIKTDSEFIFKIKNIKQIDSKLLKVIKKMKKVCFLSQLAPWSYRNKNLLKKILKDYLACQ